MEAVSYVAVKNVDVGASIRLGLPCLLRQYHTQKSSQSERENPGEGRVFGGVVMRLWFVEDRLQALILFPKKGCRRMKSGSHGRIVKSDRV